jgi:hypothetical protein
MGVQTTDFAEMARGLRLIGADHGRAVDILNDAYAATHRGELPPLEAVRSAITEAYGTRHGAVALDGGKEERTLDLEMLRNRLTYCVQVVELNLERVHRAELALTEARDALEGRKAEILREYADPEGPHAAAGGVKALGSNEEARRATLDGMVAEQTSAVGKAARELAEARFELDRIRLWNGYYRDLLRTYEVEVGAKQAGL